MTLTCLVRPAKGPCPIPAKQLQHSSHLRTLQSTVRLDRPSPSRWIRVQICRPNRPSNLEMLASLEYCLQPRSYAINRHKCEEHHHSTANHSRQPPRRSSGADAPPRALAVFWQQALPQYYEIGKGEPSCRMRSLSDRRVFLSHVSP